jgi:transcriptional regulator GlxA family with amidase domain
MQAATMTREMLMAPEMTVAPSEQTRQWLGRAVRVAFLVVGVAATAWILGQLGVLLVYGLPAPFIRRIPLAEAA